MRLDLSVYLVTDAGLCGDRGVVETVRLAVDGGVSIVQLRDKSASDVEIVDQLVELSRVIDGRALLVVNDRLDAALAARARGARVDGVHLGQGDQSVRGAREALGPDAIVGLTANSLTHLDQLRRLPPGTVDYLGVGVIRPTLTKPDHPPALGIEGFRAFAEASPLPCVAIGGVRIDDSEALQEAGAAGLAVVSALCAAADPRAEAGEFVRRWRAGAVPRVLSIAGSDPSGGAGIQADLKSIAANGGYGMAALTALTAQNTRGVRAVHVPPTDFLRAQLDAISDDITVDAVKIGMLANADVIRTVVAWLDAVRPPTVVIDPVMVATSGDRLLDAEAEAGLRELMRLADLVTPNLAELAVLVGRELSSWAEALAAAEELSAQVGSAVLVKGGHLAGADAPDALVDAGNGIRVEFPGARIETRHTHGTGCSLSSAIATRLARGHDAQAAVRGARAWLRESLRAAGHLRVGSGHGPISHFSGLWERGGVDTRPTAAALAAEWWDGVSGIRTAIDDLPFIRRLAEGTLDRESFLFYLAQDALYLREYARVLAEASKRAPVSSEQAFWANSAHGSIIGELQLHASWLTPAAGVAAATFSAAPSPVTTAYLDHLRSVAFGADYGELIAAILPCFWLYNDLGRRLHAGEFGAYARDPRHPYASWLATYADPAFDEATTQAIAVVTAAAASAGPEQRARMLRAFQTSCDHELAFFAAPLERRAIR
ncbi:MULTISPECIES: bifunctional hydroxymethylpyrimidine kinase/phosphomethylpyrimidine kinase [unclassified Microbacterium]|uniref:bifunctional hydroxymethylpyrimidine kinase/phosphomethylpyrimidine kinase n=1 Tax=unclassified Microbacterium TaxID=2609290 RepID=UPI000EA9038B|nr:MULTISPECIES: bifunctional hydroxymethylpyrimidine kinase/phosphomethylpyrimidine kinase [unclassified Microbacterium]MBT2486686.1 bifunctional hydroxymethylpyrimidine kinase/phosphomethylpyrimidine kinase [Microbacterium sp. ISL-108]RKN64627.1 bifunctional hydroxymethylpyrimidine kinase/phosphomethylpyrimidine kinase [Microbacterium sp. CGR2]